MKVGDRINKAVKRAASPILTEMVNEWEKHSQGEYDQQPSEPNNPDYMRGYEEGYEAGKVSAAMYGESKKRVKK